MPSLKDPSSTVNAGPGLLPAGVVPASSLLFIPGGGASAALNAHINNPHDAHMAHAIGIDPYYPPGTIPPTGQPLLSIVGGLIDGESVLDFINEVKDLIPPRPNAIGFNVASGVTSGIPNWQHLNIVGGGGRGNPGGYAHGTNVQFSHFIVTNVTTTFTPVGVLYPADRGVLAFYKNTSGDFTDSLNTTLVAALSLNDTAPIGVPDSAFSELTRNTGQTDYTGSGIGLDQFSLTWRLPYLTSYTPSPPFGPFSANFFRFQLAEFHLTAQSIGVGNSQDFLIVHWRETFAKTLASIQPSSLTLLNLTAANCYSAVPTSNTPYAAGGWDDPTGAAFNVNRHFVFRDSNSAVAPVGTSFTANLNGLIPSIPMSGVNYYYSGAVSWTADIQATGLFANSFQTGSVDNPPDIPAGMHSALDPIQIDWTTFGGGVTAVPYNQLNLLGAFPTLYSPTNTPQPGDTAEFQTSFLFMPAPTPFCGVGGVSQIRALLNTPFLQTIYNDPNRYLYNTFLFGGDPTTSTFEPFVTETYRYITTFDPTPSALVSLIPSGGNVFPSGTPFVSTGPDLQVAGQLVIYPHNDYSAGFLPAGNPNYTAVLAGDTPNQLRRFQRAVDTGLPRSTGWIRLRGLAQAAFTTDAAYDGSEKTGHLTGGAIIQLKVPGAGGTGWLDLGRAAGDPGIATLDFYGCSTGVVVSGPDIYVSFNTSASTSNNGSGNFLLFVRVSFVNNGAGTTIALDQFEWFPPTFVPP